MVIVTFPRPIPRTALIDDSAYEADRKKTCKLYRKEFEVTQIPATDAPFSHELTDEFKSGLYVDITTGEPLFGSSRKFSHAVVGQVLPKPIAKDVIRYYKNGSHTLCY